jgi:hypothetical protein
VLQVISAVSINVWLDMKAVSRGTEESESLGLVRYWRGEAQFAFLGGCVYVLKNTR